MLRGADYRRIDREGARWRAVLRREALPEPAPEATRGPAAQAVGPRGPVPTGRWQVTPRESWPRAPELRLDTQPRPECQRAAGAGWQRGAAGRKFRPGRVGAHQTDSPQVASLTDLLEATYGHMVNASTRPRFNL